MFKRCHSRCFHSGIVINVLDCLSCVWSWYGNHHASLSVRRAAASISMHLSLTESPVARWGDSTPPAELKLGDMGLVGVMGDLGPSLLTFLQKSKHQNCFISDVQRSEYPKINYILCVCGDRSCCSSAPRQERQTCSSFIFPIFHTLVWDLNYWLSMTSWINNNILLLYWMIMNLQRFVCFIIKNLSLPSVEGFLFRGPGWEDLELWDSLLQ